jgi:formylglycine-generating enzyme required for sulfatase activity
MSRQQRIVGQLLLMGLIGLTGLAGLKLVREGEAKAAMSPSSLVSGAAMVNSLGMRMVELPAGRFRMGNAQPVPTSLGGPLFNAPETDWDERPVHEVRLSRGFRISETEVTIEQFRQFRADVVDGGHFAPYLTGVSWEDATAFCAWLSQREGVPYRLPTEAEWEYAARAGTTTAFASGEAPPSEDVAQSWANPWGLRQMHSGPLEWCLDWHGEYPEGPVTDPVGAASGMARVVRGGGIQMENQVTKVIGTRPYYRRSANRAGMIPGWRGPHTIGFRVVQAGPPTGRPLAVEAPFIRQGVRQATDHVAAGPVQTSPWLHQRDLLPIPPENTTLEAIRASGLHPAVLGHNHSPGLVVCDNGDLLVILFTATYYPSSRYDRRSEKESNGYEYWPDTAFVATRLRYGSEIWDMPEILYDLPDVNDQTSLLWNDRGTIWQFSGGVGLPGVPFRIDQSTDHGATWSPLRFPVLTGTVGGHYPQPINSAFRDAEGTIYIPSDGIGGESLLWASRDNGATWYDTGGRTGGRHTTFALLRDGSILGMGGKSTDIDGYMPKSISKDKGKTWSVSRTPFASLGSNQRPTLIRLASGRLFFAGDFQHYNGKSPSGITERGSYVALSEDEGETWKIRRLPGALRHRSQVLPDYQGHLSGNTAGTLGYSVAKQAPNGVIHLIATMTQPAQHFELNEAWILGEEAATPSAGTARELPEEREVDREGRLRRVRHARLAADGRYQLHGPEIWYTPDGRKQYEATWQAGRRVGREVFRTEAGTLRWTWDHQPAGRSRWTHYWPNGRKRLESGWQNGRAEGPAFSWDSRGRLVQRVTFVEGEIKRE